MPTKPLATYDSAQCYVSFGDYDLHGFAPDSKVTITMDENAFNLQVGSDGEAARSKSNNKAATIVIRLQQTSDSNDVLSSYARLDELSNNGSAPLLIQCGRSEHKAAKAWVEKLPDADYANETGIREWTLRTGNLSNFIGGNV